MAFKWHPASIGGGNVGWCWGCGLTHALDEDGLCWGCFQNDGVEQYLQDLETFAEYKASLS